MLTKVSKIIKPSIVVFSSRSNILSRSRSVSLLLNNYIFKNNLVTTITSHNSNLILSNSVKNLFDTNRSLKSTMLQKSDSGKN